MVVRSFLADLIHLSPENPGKPIEVASAHARLGGLKDLTTMTTRLRWPER